MFKYARFECILTKEDVSMNLHRVMDVVYLVFTAALCCMFISIGDEEICSVMALMVGPLFFAWFLNLIGDRFWPVAFSVVGLAFAWYMLSFNGMDADSLPGALVVAAGPLMGLFMFLFNDRARRTYLIQSFTKSRMAFVVIVLEILFVIGITPMADGDFTLPIIVSAPLWLILVFDIMGWPLMNLVLCGGSVLLFLFGIMMGTLDTGLIVIPILYSAFGLYYTFCAPCGIEYIDDEGCEEPCW